MAKTPDIFDLASHASELEKGLQKAAQSKGLTEAFRRAVTPDEMQELVAISTELEKRIPNHLGGNDDAVQAPRAAKVVRLVEIYSAVAVRVMGYQDVEALVPMKSQTLENSAAFTAQGAEWLSRLFSPKN